jgi:type IV pilus assembly protein PilW
MNKKNRIAKGASSGSRQGGFSLVELMIASTLGLLILSTMVTVFVSTVRSRDEVDKSNRQIENGRFAIEMLREEVQLAAFYGDLMPTGVTWTTEDPCLLAVDSMGFTTGNVPVGIFGYSDVAAAPACVANRKAGTDIIVLRRASTTMLKVDANEDNALDTDTTTEEGTAGISVASLGKGHYLQVSNCSDAPAEISYVLAKDPTKFTLHTVKPVGTPPSCINGGRAPVRQYIVRIYYVATCNICSPSDNIPTLKMVELTPAATVCSVTGTVDCGTMETRSIAEGIENIQFEYGVDTTSDGTPESYATAPAVADWQNVMAVKIFLLARNTETSPGHIDTKRYSLASDGTLLGTAAFGDSYKRHVYVATARAVNIANRR